MEIINGRYRLVERMSSDLLGVTWMAEDLESDSKKVRLRILSLDAGEGSYLQNLISTFVQIATLVHPGLTQAYDLDVIRKISKRTHSPLQYFYTTEYVSRENEISYIELKASEIFEVLRQICYVLNYLHFRGQAYKYLNFSTITITRGPEGIRVKLLDLPTTLHYREQLGAFTDEVEQFLPPEIIHDTDSSPTSDIYSLGVLIYYLFKGEPYQNCSFDGFREGDQYQDIFRVIETMTIKNSSDRYGNVLEFIEGFRAVFPMSFDFTDKAYYEKLNFHTPIIGRDNEIDVVLAAIQKRLELKSSTRLVLINGERGIGKSRLLKELWFRAHMKRFNCCQVEVPYAQNKGRFAIKTLIRTIVSQGEVSPELIKKYGSEIVKILPEVEDQWKVLPSEELDDESEQKRLNNRLFNFIMEYAQTVPFVLFIDDFQFLSSLDLEIIGNLLMAKRQLPFIIVGAVRDDISQDYGQFIGSLDGELLESVYLNKYGFTEAAEHIRDILGAGQCSISLTAQIMREAEGNPRVIEETIKALFMFEYLKVQDNRTWTDPSEHVGDIDMDIPADDSPDYDISVFDGETLRILTSLSVFNNPAPEGAFVRMLSIAEERVAEILNRLVDDRILIRKLSDWGNTYDFLNKRIRRKILLSLSQEERTQLHSCAARFLECVYSNDSEVHSESLVYHLTNSGQLEKAVHHANQIAKQLEAMNQNGQALDFYLRVKGLLMDMGSLKAIPALLIKLGDLNLKLNDSEKAYAHFMEAQERALELGLTEDEIDAAIRSCNIRVTMKDLNTAEEDMRTVLHRCIDLPYFNGEIEAVLVLCKVLMVFGRFEESRSLVAPYLNKLKGTGEDYSYGRLMNEKGVCDMYTGRPSEAFMALLESDRCLERTKNTLERLRPLTNLGILNFDYLGDLSKSREYFRRVIDLSERANVIWGLDMVYSNISETYMKEDDFERALGYLNRACHLAEKAKHNDMLFYIYSNLCLVYLSCCQYDEAFRYLSKLDYEFFNRRGHALNVALYFLCHIRFSLEMGFYEDALHWYKKAYGDGIHIPDNLEFEFKLLKLKIDQLSCAFPEERDMGLHIKSMLKATSNPMEIGLIRDFILDQGLGYLMAGQPMSTGDILRIDEDLVETFDTPRLKIKRDLLEAVLSEDWQSRVEQLLKQDKLENYPVEKWIALWHAGRLYELNKDAYSAMTSYYSAMDVLRMIAVRVPEKFRNSFIFNDKFKVGLHDQLQGLIARLLSNHKPEPTNEMPLTLRLQDFFEIKDEERLLGNQRFLNSVYKRYEKKQGVRFKNIQDLLEQYGTDEYRNILSTLKYMVQLTFADRGFFFFNRDYALSDEVIATEKSHEIPDISRFSVMLEFDSEGVFIKNRGDLRTAAPSRRGTEALMVIPVRHEGAENDAPGRRRSDEKEQSGKILGYIYLQSDKQFNNFTEVTFQACKVVMRSLCVLVENYHLKRTSLIDRLTAVFLRKHIESKLTEELERSKESKLEMSIIMADIDHFKNVNDVYGHQKGDEILREIGKTIQMNLRKGDLVGRYGGEEFIMVLPETGDIDAYKVCEKIRESIESSVFVGDKSPVTMSFGIASYPAHGVVEEELIERADQALYESKHMGRNRTMVWTSNIGNSKQRFDKLTGILEGNISADSRKVQAMVDIMSLINRPIGKEGKIYEILSQLVDISEAQAASVVHLKDNAVVEVYSRTVGIDGLDRNAKISDVLVADVINRGCGDYSVDWVNLYKGERNQDMTDWLSYITVPLVKDGDMIGILVLSVPISRHEFDFKDFNYVNTLSGVISVILNEAER